MAVGNQATPSSINNILTQYAIALRDDCQNIANLYEYITTLGVAGLENLGGTGLGFSPADAATVVTMVSYLNTLAIVFNGTGTQASQFNFGNALSSLYAGG